MVAGRTIVDADMGVASFLKSVDACDLHFLPAPTCRQFGTAGHQQTLERGHGATTLQGTDSVYHTAAMHKPNFSAQPVSDPLVPGKLGQ
jgi:hypothetical protein